MSLRFEVDVLLSKVATVRRCVATIAGLWNEAEPGIPAWLRLDATVLNLQRAVEACLDMANHLVAANSWGLPGAAIEAIQLLVDNKVVNAADLPLLRGMIGFRNIAVHDYRQIDEAIVAGIVREHLGDLMRFADRIMAVTVNQCRER